MTDRPLGHLEITSRLTPKGVLLHPGFIEVKLNGKIIPGLQQIDIHLTADEFPIITLKFIPTSLEIDLDGVKTKVVKS